MLNRDDLITATFCRAARGWLHWTVDELAAKATVSPRTIRDFEGQMHTPIPQNRLAIERALAHAGVTPLRDTEWRIIGIQT